MSSVNKAPRPWLPGIIFLALCGAIALLLINRPSETTSRKQAASESPKTNVAKTNFSLSLTNAPQSPEDRATVLTAEGNQFLAQGNFPAAAEKFQQAVAISPDQEDLHYNLGIALARQGRVQEAKKEYEEALRIFPDYAEALNNLGNLLMNEGKLDDAIARFREAIKNAPDNASFHNNLGTAFGRQNNLFEARAQFEEAVKRDPNYVQARVNLANTSLVEGRVDEAIAQLEEALRLRPDFGPALQTLQRARQRKAASVPK